MQTILGTLKYYEKNLGSDRKQQFAELMSAIRKFLLRGWGFPSTSSSRSTEKDIENAEYALANLPIEKMYDWKEALERGFDLENKNTKQRTVPRSHINKFVRWCFEKGILIDPAIGKQTHKTTPSLYALGGSRPPKMRRNLVQISRYTLPQSEFTPQLEEEIQKYRRYLEANFYPKRRAKAVRETTGEIRIQSLCRILGWLHFHGGIPKEELSLNLLIRPTDLNNVSEAEAAAEEFRSIFENFVEFLKERGNQYGNIASYLAGLTRLVQFQYLGKHSDKHGNDIPVMRTIREMIEYYERLSEDELESVPLENKWLDLPEIIQKITLPLFSYTEAKTKYKNLRPQNAIASSFQDALLWGLFSLMPPRRSGEWRNCKIAMSCPIGAKPQDLKDGEWIWPLPENRWVKEEIKYSYLTRQYVYHDPVTSEKFGSYLGTVPPSDRYLERIAVWYKDTPSQAAKSGDSHKYQRYLVMDRVVYRGKRFYDFLEAYIMGYWRDKFGNWTSLGESAEQPAPGFKFYSLRSAIVKDSIPPLEWLFVGRDSGERYRQGDFGHKKIGLAAYRMSRKFVTPHLLRSIYAVHMIESGCSRELLSSLAEAMGHTLKTLENIYDKRRPHQKTRLIEADIQQRIDNVCAGLPTSTSKAPALPVFGIDPDFWALLTPQQQNKYWQLKNKNQTYGAFE